jgi:predicted Fe-Mo cluster-binding NifX family protein
MLSVVTIAIPIWQQRVSPVLDAATRLLVVTRQRGAGARRREVVLCPLEPEAFARSVAELHVDVLLCAALSEGLLCALRKQGVRVHPHLCGEVEAVLHAFCNHRLAGEEFRMPGCWGNHSHGGCYRSREVGRRTRSASKTTKVIMFK